MSQVDAALLADLLRQAMDEGKHPYLTVISNSMSPLIRRGDQIRVSSVSAEKLNPGDIVVFLGPAQLITHRYWGCISQGNQTRFVTKGDRPQHFDQPFAPSRLVGRVIGRRRNDKLLNLAAGSGRWLNNHLANLVKLEIRLFTEPLALPLPTQAQLPLVSGRFSNSSKGIFIRVFRRFSYSWAIILTLFVSGLTSAFNKTGFTQAEPVEADFDKLNPL